MNSERGESLVCDKNFELDRIELRSCFARRVLTKNIYIYIHIYGYGYIYIDRFHDDVCVYYLGRVRISCPVRLNKRYINETLFFILNYLIQR